MAKVRPSTRLLVGAATVNGAGALGEVFTGTGAAAAQSASVSGSGSSTTTVTGTGAVAAQSAVVSGSDAAPNTITTLTLTNTLGSSSNGRVELFGQGFARGDVPSGETLQAEVAGVSAPLQVARESTWPDGSLRYAVLAVVSGDFSASQSKSLAIQTGGSGPSGSNITLSDLPNDATEYAELTLGAETITANRTNLLAAGGELEQIFTGPHCAQWIYRPQYSSVPRVRAAFHITAFRTAGSGTVDSIEWSGGNECVDIRIDEADHGTVSSRLHRFSVNGSTVYSETAVMYQYTRWHRWESLPDVHVIHDHDYLDTTGLVLPVRADFNVLSSALNWYQTETTAGYTPNDGINDTRGWRWDMSIGGADEGDIGPVPAWDQAYRVAAAGSDGAGWREQVWLRSEGGGRHQVHYYDEDNARPVQIGPGANQYTAGGLNPDLGVSAFWGSFPDAPWTGPGTDVAHQPRFGYTQYLLFGRYFFLEEQQYWGAMCCGNGSGGYSSSTKYNLWCWDQTRAEAWGTLSVACAAVLAPDGDAMRTYFEAAMARNITEAWDENYAPGQAGHSVTGAIVNEYPPERSSLLGQDRWIISWQSDFVNIANCWAWMMGYDGSDPSLPDYSEYSDFTSRWPIGRVHKLGAQNTALYWCDVNSGANSPPSSWADFRFNLYQYNTSETEAFRPDSAGYNSRNNSVCRMEEPDTAAWRAGWTSPLGATESVGNDFEPGGDQSIAIASLACSYMRGANGAQEAWDKFNALTLTVNNGETEDPSFSGRSPARAEFDLRITSAFPRSPVVEDGPGDWIQSNVPANGSFVNTDSTIGARLAIDYQAVAYSGGGCGGGYAYVFGGGHNNGANDAVPILDLRKIDTYGWTEVEPSTADWIGAADADANTITTYMSNNLDSVAGSAVRDERGLAPVSRHTYGAVDVDWNGHAYLAGASTTYDWGTVGTSPPWGRNPYDVYRYRPGIGWDWFGVCPWAGSTFPNMGLGFDFVDQGRIWVRTDSGLGYYDFDTGWSSNITNGRFFGDEQTAGFAEDVGSAGGWFEGGGIYSSTWGVYDIGADSWSASRGFPSGQPNTLIYVPSRFGSNYGAFFCYTGGQIYRYNEGSGTWSSIASGGPSGVEYGRFAFDEIHQVFIVTRGNGDGNPWSTYLCRPYAYEAP